jgi:type II secretory pathway predicted ATPase ExeA
MYEAFYGLRERPFSLTPDPAFLFLSRQHRYALTMLEYALSFGSGFALVSGEVGSGKTTLIRHLLRSVSRDLTVGLVTNTHRGLGALLPWIAQSLGLKPGGRPETELYEAFVDYLLAEYAAGRRVVLIVDEAQNLGPAALEELRVLSNINTDKDLLLQTILVGQPELRTLLQRPSLRQFAQRVAIDFHLGTLDREDTHAYVRHRLKVAGGSPELIAADAIEMLFARTAGVPRLINSLCEMALVYGFAEQRRPVDAELVAQAIRDRAAGGLLPGGAAPARAPTTAATAG